jgi:hypothetical protein
MTVCCHDEGMQYPVQRKRYACISPNGNFRMNEKYWGARQRPSGSTSGYERMTCDMSNNVRQPDISQGLH